MKRPPAMSRKDAELLKRTLRRARPAKSKTASVLNGIEIARFAYDEIIDAMQNRGLTYEQISALIEERGTHVSAGTLANYISQIRKERAAASAASQAVSHDADGGAERIGESAGTLANRQIQEIRQKSAIDAARPRAAELPHADLQTILKQPTHAAAIQVRDDTKDL